MISVKKEMSREQRNHLISVDMLDLMSENVPRGQATKAVHEKWGVTTDWVCKCIRKTLADHPVI